MSSSKMSAALNADGRGSRKLDRRSFIFGAAAIALSRANETEAALGGTTLTDTTPARATSKPHVIRHYVLATSHIETVSAELQEFLVIPPGERHDMAEILGFRNEMMKIGNTLLEMVQPVKPDHRLHRWLAERGGDGGYMIVLQTFDAEALRARAAAEKLRLTRDMQFRGQQMIQFDPRRFGTHFETYQYSLPNGWWGDPDGRNYGKSQVAEEIVGAEVAVENPTEIAAQIGRLFESPVSGDSVSFVDKKVRFVAPQAQLRGLIALDLKGFDRTRIGDHKLIGGVTWRLV